MVLGKLGTLVTIENKINLGASTAEESFVEDGIRVGVQSRRMDSHRELRRGEEPILIQVQEQLRIPSAVCLNPSILNPACSSRSPGMLL